MRARVAFEPGLALRVRMGVAIVLAALLWPR
jgi:hypothetical protein